MKHPFPRSQSMAYKSLVVPEIRIVCVRCAYIVCLSNYDEPARSIEPLSTGHIEYLPIHCGRMGLVGALQCLIILHLETTTSNMCIDCNASCTDATTIVIDYHSEKIKDKNIV